ncbi:hypothetical protein ABL78_1987 [Leptomonas seymouri]|uniref:Lipid-binding serum glycoprotein C-terminal domain-containing protein n=1 Tax=Leptomonas seymouri TaxID=5684 RepID=A0A0N1PCM7_LEPSE|nr:hypothetical protein ABL78_1987 [Leptomonas seymouri]|eukprot:KPI88870.1 hypothetical protein ABL78_1987 [Leptomonas seymouri]
MITQCFFLAALVTTMVNMSASNISVWSDSRPLALGPHMVLLSNVKPGTLTLGATSINSTAAGFTVDFAEPMRVDFVADVIVDGDLPLSNLSIDANVSGFMRIDKSVSDTCATGAFAMADCTLKLDVFGKLPFMGDAWADHVDICDSANVIVTKLLTPKPLDHYPAPQKDTTSLEKSTYLMRLRLVNFFAESTGMPVKADFVAPNAVRLGIGAPMGLSLNFHSEDKSDVEIFDAITVLGTFAKKLLNVSLIPMDGNSIVIPYASGEVRLPTLHSLIHQAIAEAAVVSLETQVPRSSGLVFDVIVNDFRCKAFNIVCSLPAEGGVQVVNARFVGLGDLGTILDNTIGADLDELLTKMTDAAFKHSGSTFHDRIYLPVF